MQVLVRNDASYWRKSSFQIIDIIEVAPYTENRGKREVVLAEYLSTSKLLHYLSYCYNSFQGFVEKGI